MATTAVKRYMEAVGRRKTAVARVRITPGARLSVEVNGKDLAAYFPVESMRMAVLSPLEKSALPEKFAVTVRVHGGGLSAQSEAVRHGISRALLEHSADLRKPLKQLGFLKRDPRAKERRKFGLKKARKAAQWSKR